MSLLCVPVLLSCGNDDGDRGGDSGAETGDIEGDSDDVTQDPGPDLVGPTNTTDEEDRQELTEGDPGAGDDLSEAADGADEDADVDADLLVGPDSGDVAELSGTYLLAVSTVLAPGVPLHFQLDIVHDTGGALLDATLVALITENDETGEPR